MIKILHFITYSEDEKDTSISDEREGQIDQKFYGPATSCDELGKIGYTLNGYYIVKAKPQSIVRSSHKFEIVYCQFYQPLLGQRHQGTTKESKSISNLRILLPN